MSYYLRARDMILNVHETLPANISFEDRKKAIYDAYPFGVRQYWPYKMWLKAQREYLFRYAPPVDMKRFPLSPMEKMIARTESRQSRLASVKRV